MKKIVVLFVLATSLRMVFAQDVLQLQQVLQQSDLQIRMYDGYKDDDATLDLLKQVFGEEREIRRFLNGTDYSMGWSMHDAGTDFSLQNYNEISQVLEELKTAKYVEKPNKIIKYIGIYTKEKNSKLVFWMCLTPEGKVVINDNWEIDSLWVKIFPTIWKKIRPNNEIPEQWR